MKKVHCWKSTQVNAHRTKKERQEITLLEEFVTEGNEKAGELAKEGALLDEGFTIPAEMITDAGLLFSIFVIKKQKRNIRNLMRDFFEVTSVTGPGSYQIRREGQGRRGGEGGGC